MKIDWEDENLEDPTWGMGEEELELREARRLRELRQENANQQATIDKLLAYIRGEIPMSEIEDLIAAEPQKGV